MSENTKNKTIVALSAIDPVVINNVPVYSEKKARGRGYVNYGENNLFPEYL